MKYVVVGSSHAGFEVIQTLLKEDNDVKFIYMRKATNLHSYHAVYKVI